MRLITLNAWGGKLFEPLMDLIKNQAADTDVFCFQDVLFGSKPDFSPIQRGRLNLFDEIKTILKDFHSITYRDPDESYIHGELLPQDVGCGQVIFVKQPLNVLEHGGFRSHPDSPYHKGGDLVSGRCQWINLNKDGERIVILNLHGLWQRNSQKRDTKERIEQSHKINQFLSDHKGKKILCGDFNIINDGNAMAILEEEMINLIKKYDIKSTRSSHYPKQERFADYVLVSPDIDVVRFGVLEEEVSDHLALKLEFV